MKIDEVKQVKIVENEEEINSFLKDGFELIKILSVKKNENRVIPQFILGKREKKKED